MSSEVEIVVRARDQSAIGIDRAKGRLKDLEEAARRVPKDVRVKAEADVAKAEADLAALGARKIKVDVDTAAAVAKLEQLRAFAREALGDEKVKVDADIAQAEAKLHMLRARRLKVDLDTGAATMKIEKLRTEMDSLGSPLARLRDRLREVATKGFSPLVTAALTLGPSLLPVLGQAVTIAGSLANSLAGAGAAAGVFGAVVKSTFGDVQEASTKTDGLREKIRLLNEEIKLAPAGSKLHAEAMKSQAKATLELNARLALLPPATRKVVTAFGDMKSSWEDFKDANKGEAFGFLTRGFDLVKKIIPQLQPLFDAGAKAANTLMSMFERKVADGGFRRLVDYLANSARRGLPDVIGILRGLARAIGGFLKATDDGGGALHWVRGMVDKLADFTKGKAFADFLQWVRDNGKKVGEYLGNLAQAAMKIADAMGPLAPISLTIATALSAIIAAIPQPVLTTIIGLFMAWSIVSKALWLVMSASPIGLIILAVAALVVGVIYAYQHCKTFRDIVNGVWQAIKIAATVVVAFARVLISHVAQAVAFVIDRFGDMADFVGGVLSHIPGMGAAGEALKGLGRKAHDAAQKIRDVADAIAGVHGKVVALTVRVSTATVNGQSVSIRDSGSGGVTFITRGRGGSVHSSRAFAHGGITGHAAEGGPRADATLVGENGPELVDLAPGSQVHSNPDTQRLMGGAGAGSGQPLVIVLQIGDAHLGEIMIDPLRKAVRARGGNVQVALGR